MTTKNLDSKETLLENVVENLEGLAQKGTTKSVAKKVKENSLEPLIEMFEAKKF